MAKEKYQTYDARKEPGTYQGEEHLRWKAQAGEPTAPARSRLRKQCNPHGAIGLLLETIHLQASSLDKKGSILEWNQPAISLKDTPYQHLRALLRQAAAWNRTLAAEGMRKESQGLKEIDLFATQGCCKELNAEDLSILHVIRTGSTWTKDTAFWTGEATDQICSLCRKEKETPEHILWLCEGIE